MEREPQDKKLFHRWGEFAFVLGTFFIALGVSLMEKGDLGMSMVTITVLHNIPCRAFFHIRHGGLPASRVLLIGYYIIVRRFDWKNILSFFSAFIFEYCSTLCKHLRSKSRIPLWFCRNSSRHL